MLLVSLQKPYKARKPSPFLWRIARIIELPSWATPTRDDFTIPSGQHLYTYRVIFPGYYDLEGWRVASSKEAIQTFLEKCFDTAHRHKVSPCPSRYFMEPAIHEYVWGSLTEALPSVVSKIKGVQA